MIIKKINHIILEISSMMCFIFDDNNFYFLVQFLLVYSMFDTLHSPEEFFSTSQENVLVHTFPYTSVIFACPYARYSVDETFDNVLTSNDDDFSSLSPMVEP